MYSKNSIITIQAFFDEMAKTYVNKFDDKIIDSIVELCNIRPDSILLEAGSGTSDFTSYLLQQIDSQGKIFCNDISEKMLTIARKKIKDPRVTFLSGDITSISFASLKIDKVICFNMFPHISDKLRFVQNVYGNLARGGELIICHDRNRDAIVSMHRRHGIAEALSHFPEMNDIISLLKSSHFRMNHVIDDEFFFIRAIKA